MLKREKKRPFSPAPEEKNSKDFFVLAVMVGTTGLEPVTLCL